MSRVPRNAQSSDEQVFSPILQRQRMAKTQKEERQEKIKVRYGALYIGFYGEILWVLRVNFYFLKFKFSGLCSMSAYEWEGTQIKQQNNHRY